MPWTDHPGPTPRRSEEELLEAVRRRAGRLRRARRARLSAGIAGVAAVVVVAAALARAGDDGSTELHVVGPSTTVVTSLETTTLPPTPTTVSPTTAPSTTRTTAPTTTRRSTTTVRPTTTTTVVTLVTCDASEVVIIASPDRSTYPQGTNIVVTAAALNRGSRTCIPYDPQLEFFDATGAVVGGAGIADAFTMGIEGQPPPAWDPGETLSLPFPWPAVCREGGRCPPGQYTVRARFGPFQSAPASFTIT